ncbi:OmpH family outer membrane protein [Desulfurivibrio dismutans]|uniref:OmpH family outer membrane protein n=1 Tax=Desulfurivibrio dismutans TaxID=1398908 RepID=UPI0023DAA477|nr:OmpH family outer membrane protein [Desulfurivibrio alkaliphilus]MDF1614817.1 OmpH family outer membrane protein [Desulfurivibrio alkaliphilus]
MKNRFAASLLAVFLLLAFWAVPAAAAEGRIATMSVQKVLDNSAVAGEARRKIEAEFEKHRTSLQREQRELEELHQEIEQKSAVWSEQVRTQKERELQRRYREFEARNEDAQLAVQELEQELMEPVLGALNEIIDEVGRENGYDLILEYTMKGLRTRTGLLYATDSLDISIKVQEKLDARLGDE